MPRYYHGRYKYRSRSYHYNLNRNDYYYRKAYRLVKKYGPTVAAYAYPFIRSYLTGGVPMF